MPALPESILLCIAAPLLIALPFLRPEPRALVVHFCLGMLACLASGYVSGAISILRSISPEDIAVYYSPLIEETSKLLPVLYVLLANNADDTQLFQIAPAIGTGFATFENCCYLISSTPQSTLQMLVRGMAVGVMHVGCTIILVIGLVFARKHRVFMLSSTLGALALAQTLHALYNLLVSIPGIPAYVGYGLPLLAIALLMFTGRKKRFCCQR